MEKKKRISYRTLNCLMTERAKLQIDIYYLLALFCLKLYVFFI